MGDSANTGPSSSQRRPLNVEALKNHILAHKIDCALWAIRLWTILFSFGYFVPLFWSSQSVYYKALLANAATSALRLHQRLSNVQFTRAFLAELIMEDSCHYLFYSLIFLFVAPVTFVLIPILLFAILHLASYSLTLLDTLGQNSWWGARLLISLVEFQSLNILRMAAFGEIVIMPLTALLVLLGKASLLTPFIYYQFLAQRYSSRRNPYTRNMFRELRVLFEFTAAKPNMPGFLKNILLLVVNFTCKLAPPQMAQPQHQQ